MTTKHLGIILTFSAALAIQPAVPQSRSFNEISGFLRVDASCPQAGYALTACSCPGEPIYRHVFSTKVDLSRYADHFVSLRGSSQPGNCAVELFEAKKATLEPNRPCPCP